MKVLSVKNPWAYLIAWGAKNVENRTWKTPYRGELYIHCSGIDLVDFHINYLPEEIQDYWQANWKAEIEKQSYEMQPATKIIFAMNELNAKIQKEGSFFYKSGLIIGKVNLVDIVKDSQSIWAEPNAYHWILENPVLLETPIQAKGKLGIWDYNLIPGI
jgi:hypothetical protein